MRKTAFIAVLTAILCLTGCGSGRHIETSCIWDHRYSAFPSIVEFQGRYYVSFREADSHVFNDRGRADGTVRILVSSNGRRWKSAALLSKDGFDLRDPKLSATPDGRLMVTIGGSIYEGRELLGQIPHVAFSSDGRTFSDPEPVIFDENITDRREWIWRVTWHDGTGYGVTYGDHYALVSTTDGLHYKLVKELDLDKGIFPGESTIRFAPDGRMLMMVRCERGDRMGRWGVSEAPYTDWTWTEMDQHLGGPDFIVLDNGMVVAGTRYEFPRGKCRTILLTGKLEGDFQERYLLPSGGDTSYPGFIEVGDELWMVYYSCHESASGNSSGTMYEAKSGDVSAPRARIYLARIPKSMLF